MDAIDREILAQLQNDARTTVTRLAEGARISVSACHRRLRELQDSGVILGYRARLDPAAIGLGFGALVFVTMRDNAARTLETFERELTQVPEVLDAQRLFGEMDYMVRVATADLQAFQRLYDGRLAALPGVQKLSSTLIMKEIVTDRPLPVTTRRR